jgi:serine/threonine protein kinase/formylglycine-generating enzyme required for sulfatase activity
MVARIGAIESGQKGNGNVAQSGVPPSDLLFGLFAWQNGLINQGVLFEVLKDCTAETSHSVADLLVKRGIIEQADRLLLERLVARHVERHGGDIGHCLESLHAERATCEDITASGPDDLELTLSYFDHKLKANGEAAWDDAAAFFAGKPTSVGGRYRVVRLHARGGLGEVYVAIDSELKREVALKQIQDDYADDARSRQRFLLEAEITGRLEHPGIVPIYGLGFHEHGRPYYAMRLIRGESLKHAIAAFHGAKWDAGQAGAHSLELRKLLARFLAVCDAVAYAHGRGVLHRDIKPSNVMLGPYGETLVVDWGLAKAVGQVDPAGLPQEPPLDPESASEILPTQAGSRLGTPGYMAPEQFAGKLDQVGPRSDVYSLGATLYTILTGQPPYTGRSLADVLPAMEKGQFTPPRKIKSWIDEALEAVCLKAMAFEAEKRYAGARELADDIQRWLADEPVLAWREPLARRMGRWARRHRTLVTSSTVAAILAAAVGLYLLNQAQIRLKTANGRADALLTAEVRSIPAIREQLAPDLSLVRARLVRIAQDKAAEDRHRLAASLALLHDDLSHASFLIERAVRPEASPDEVLVIRDELAARGGGKRAVEGYRQVLAGGGAVLSDSDLRAAGMLARLAPDDEIWKMVAPKVARKVVQENPVWLGQWRAAFEPVARYLLVPLRQIFADPTQPDWRDRAFTLLEKFANRPDDHNRVAELAELLIDADPDRARSVVGLLGTSNDRQPAVHYLVPKLAKIAQGDEREAARQGRIAVALVQLGEAETVWPLFALRDDSSVRTEVTHELGHSGIDPALLVERLRGETNVSARRSLLLCLGEFDPASINQALRKSLEIELLAWYRSDPDAGVHGAVGWVLRERWGAGRAIETIDGELASKVLPNNRGWFVNSLRQTYTLIHGPVSLRAGSNKKPVQNGITDEPQFTIQIPRSFAISAREVTRRDFDRFLAKNPQGARDSRGTFMFAQIFPSLDCAVGLLNWYEAARYCNWLSEQEGIPEKEWCYPRDCGPNMELPKNHLERLGYRLPTEAEWEYSCKAGSAWTPRPYGLADSRLGDYAWFSGNEGVAMHVVGQKKPNDLGLFDMLGNAYEWCLDARGALAPRAGDQLVDRTFPGRISDDITVAVRGGAFNNPAADIRSARHIYLVPSSRLHPVGFRPVRTVP